MELITVVISFLVVVVISYFFFTLFQSFKKTKVKKVPKKVTVSHDVFKFTKKNSKVSNFISNLDNSFEEICITGPHDTLKHINISIPTLIHLEDFEFNFFFSHTQKSGTGLVQFHTGHRHGTLNDKNDVLGGMQPLALCNVISEYIIKNVQKRKCYVSKIRNTYIKAMRNYEVYEYHIDMKNSKRIEGYINLLGAPKEIYYKCEFDITFGVECKFVLKNNYKVTLKWSERANNEFEKLLQNDYEILKLGDESADIFNDFIFTTKTTKTHINHKDIYIHKCFYNEQSSSLCTFIKFHYNLSNDIIIHTMFNAILAMLCPTMGMEVLGISTEMEKKSSYKFRQGDVYKFIMKIENMKEREVVRNNKKEKRTNIRISGRLIDLYMNVIMNGQGNYIYLHK